MEVEPDSAGGLRWFAGFDMPPAFAVSILILLTWGPHTYLLLLEDPPLCCHVRNVLIKDIGIIRVSHTGYIIIGHVTHSIEWYRSPGNRPPTTPAVVVEQCFGQSAFA